MLSWDIGNTYEVMKMIKVDSVNIMLGMLILGIGYTWACFSGEFIVGEPVNYKLSCMTTMLPCSPMMPIITHLVRMRRNKRGGDGDDAPADGKFGAGWTCKLIAFSGLHLEIFLVKVL